MAATGVAAIREDCEICRARMRPFALRGGGELARCERCGHLLRDLDEAPGAHRDLAYGGEPTLDRIRLDLTYRAMRRAAPGGTPRSVFEVGYGSGSMLRRFLDGGASIAGADPDQLRIDVDPRVVAQGRLSGGAVEDVPRDGADPVDLVYGIHVLEHVVDPVATLAVAFELVRPGGTVQFFTPAGDSDGVRLYGAAWWMLEDPTHVRFFTADSLARAATDAGFVDVEVRRPVLDSLTTDAASAVRRWRPASRPRGVLASRGVIATGLASAPLVLAARAVRPGLRPTLHLIARRPA
ncbi:methyltransferase domain-containing protein [Allobranchiibius sp. CTAmp26]|uniref:methyltransferase domain-containing protein n=1 Tax=Allobranchiibius sp. CTAmp26 TaxID=2815214 RepID=UPI001AA1B039|nr:methyltransferase domain-containing protein [Allobranchiibius sp. CTAmp26]MBO1754072.1 methyltransferase domain-containing protein [Allobranchiibius sp. CTAmp26]